MKQTSETLNVIAHIQTDFATKFGIPRQSGVVWELGGKIVFEKEYRSLDALKGLEDYTYIWLLWQFSENLRHEWTPTVRPPRLGGNIRVGVYATRSPFRPSPIGLSCVKLEGISMDDRDGPVIYVSGVDMMDGTPIYDIKPYLPYTDSHPDAKGGFSEKTGFHPLEVVFAEEQIEEQLNDRLGEDKVRGLKAALEQDPRPAYHDSDERVYGFEYAGTEIRFTVVDRQLKILAVY